MDFIKIKVMIYIIKLNDIIALLNIMTLMDLITLIFLLTNGLNQSIVKKLYVSYITAFV